MRTSKFVRQIQARSVARVALLDSQPSQAARPEIFSQGPEGDRRRYELEQQIQSSNKQQCSKGFSFEIDEATRKQLAASATQIKREQGTHDNTVSAYQRDELDLSFNDAKTAYKSKTTGQLLRNWFVLGLCSQDILVRNNEKLMKLARRVLGKQAFNLLMKSTFYGQFVAGADEQEIEPVITHLRSFGVKTILDYSAEEDVRESGNESSPQMSCPVGESNDMDNNANELNYLEDSSLRRYLGTNNFADRRRYLPVARTYFYHGESQCEKNLEIFFKSIEAVANSTANTGFAAIKLTALGRPKLLMKLSKIIDYMKQIEGQQSSDSLPELLARFNSLNQNHISSLDEDEEEMLYNLMRRVNRIAAYASQVGGARCMIDAEQTYMQPAINMIAMELMRKYNKREAIIFNTYQCYLKQTYDQVRRDLASARAENFFFGAKLVRGAYMDQERARAAKLGYEDPINESFEATTAMYERTLKYLMEEIRREMRFDPVGQMDMNNRRISIMVATHNEDAVRFTLEQMERLGIKPEHRLICFGQLYGMCDHISFTLGQSGYSVYKYLPYGPLEEVLPYLGRRAIENHGFLSKLQRERSLLAKELMSRMLTLRWFYKPMGNYRPV